MCGGGRPLSGLLEKKSSAAPLTAPLQRVGMGGVKGMGRIHLEPGQKKVTALPFLLTRRLGYVAPGRLFFTGVSLESGKRTGFSPTVGLMLVVLFLGVLGRNFILTATLAEVGVGVAFLTAGPGLGREQED